MEGKTKIELSEEEAEVFKWCWKNYKVFKEAIRVLRPGKLILNFDSRADIKPEFILAGNRAVDKLRESSENKIKSA